MMQLALTRCGKQPAGLVAVMPADALHLARVQGDGQNSSAAAPLGGYQESVLICSSTPAFEPIRPSHLCLLLQRPLGK